ncbi:MAG: 4-hydroxy-tetrahydrodipicolinate synthase [Chloroflexi bacterium]|nr:4-hydroxy-tetrahydrodipicolinate synthase [Chloroflexota bacterium]
MTFGRLITAVVTPFHDDGSVDYDTFGRMVDGLIDAGNDAVVVTGTTGESPVLTETERVSLYREALSTADGRARVIAGTGGYNTSESIHLSRAAADVGVDGLLQVTPYYNKPPQAGLFRHFEAIAASTPLPNILYNVPGRTSCNLEAATVAELSAIDNIIGIKEASADFEQIGHIARSTPDDFAIYSGNDADTYLIMALGGVGVVSVASHVVSGEIRAMIDAFVAGDLDGARTRHLHLLPISQILFPAGWPNPVSVKAALGLGGFDVGVPRLPLVDLPDNMKASLRAVMDAYELDAYLTRTPVAV